MNNVMATGFHTETRVVLVIIGLAIALLAIPFVAGPAGATQLTVPRFPQLMGYQIEPVQDSTRSQLRSREPNGPIGCPSEQLFVTKSEVHL